jgi:hypothetical protein
MSREEARRMDPDQFDALVQRLVAAQSRREALTGAVGGALASIGITSIADARRKRPQGKSESPGKRKKKHRQNNRSDHDDERHNDDSAERLGRRNRKRKRDKDNRHGDKKNKKKRRDNNRCKKNGQPCVRDGKCCSKHCDPNSGTCTRRPGS